MAESLAASIGLATVVYASTNIDDLLILAVFFADPRVHVAAVVTGRYLGLAALVLASGAVAVLALAVPAHWVALLGLVPLALGLRLLPALWRGDGTDAEDDEARAAAQIPPRHGFAGQALAVAGVTLANGGDNLGVYIPLFAASPSAIVGYTAVFAVMTIVWCGLGYLAVNNPLIGATLRRYGHVILPVVLILLGLYILSGAAGFFR